MSNKSKLAAVLLLSIPTLLFSMEEEPSNIDRVPRLSTTVMDPIEHLRYMREHEVAYDPAKHYFHGASFKEMEDVFENAPPKAKNLVAYLRAPFLFKGNEFGNAAFLIGEPGAGKTTLAKAIAYKAGWECAFMTSADVQGVYRNETASNLRTILDRIISRNKPTVTIIDELNRLLEHYESKHHDTDMTSTTLWTFLDEQLSNPKFFLIGTMNQADKIPQQIKSRVRAQWIHLPPITDPEEKRKTFLSKLVDDTTILHRECNAEFLDRHLRQLDVGRDFQSLASSACEIFRREDKTSPIREIRKKHIIQAIKELKEMDQLVKYGEKEETDEERQERHYRQNIRATLIAQTRQRSQVTTGINGGVSLGVSGLGGNIGASLSETSAPGMSREDAERTWQEAVPNSGETLFRENEQVDGTQDAQSQSLTKNKPGTWRDAAAIHSDLTSDCTIQ